MKNTMAADYICFRVPVTESTLKLYFDLVSIDVLTSEQLCDCSWEAGFPYGV